MLQVRNLTKVYTSAKNKVVALSNVSVNFGSSGLVVVLGKSGCGKSTLLNILGGLDTPTFGNVIVNGRDMTDFKAGDYDAYRNTYVGIVFQEFNLIDEITVYENIDMTLKLQEKSADVLAVEEALHLVGLSNLGYRKPTELSGGQRQRVALARALLKKPEIILADEPTGSLDSVTAEEVFESLKKISESKLVIIVTHEKALADKYADRVVEIVDGQITADRTKVSDENEEKKSLCDNVLAVSSGTNLTVSDIRLEKDKVNYIGFTADKDRVALAYPETVEGFYAFDADSEFKKTEPSEIKDNKKEFKLSKGKLRISDAMKMARQNMKRTKKRYKFLTRIAIVCFTFFALSFIIGTTSMTSVVADSAFSNTTTPVVSAMKVKKDTYGQLELLSYTNEDIAKVKQILNVNNVGKVVAIQATPSYMSGISKQVVYGMSEITGVIEDARPSDFGIKLIAGKETVSENEIVISDLLAFELMRSRYIGYTNQGVFGIVEPLSLDDIIGSQLQISETQKFYKINGIFATESDKYSKLIDPNIFDTEVYRERMAFLQLRSMLSGRIFAPSGFSSAFLSESDSTLSNYSVRISNENSNYGYIFNVNMAELTINEQITNNMTWTANGEKITALKDNECIIPLESLWEVIKIDNWTGSITPEIAEKLAAAEVSMDFMRNRVTEYNKTFKVVGVTSYYSGAVSQSVIAELRKAQANCLQVIYPRGMSSMQLLDNIQKLEKAGFVTGTIKANAIDSIAFDVILKTLSTVFTWIGLIMAVFIFIILFNYMSMSVRFRQKEVAVYRVVGAKKIDISKIFFTEGGFIVGKITIWASIFTFLIISLINSMLSAVLLVMSASFNILTFNFLLHPLFILFVSAAFVLVSTIIPIFNIVNRKPSDAVRMIAV